MSEHAQPWRFALLLPTRGRPHNLARLHSAIQDTAVRPDLIDVWCYIDDDDPAGLAAYEATEVPANFYVGPRRKLAESWNILADVVTRESEFYTHFLLWGDDVIPETSAWDLHFVNATINHGPGFYYGMDGVWDHTFNEDRSHPNHLRLPTAVAMTTDAYRALGYVSPPGLVHLCIDLAWRDLGIASGTLNFLPQVMIRHLHRVVGAPDDQTYRDANDDQEQKRTDSLAFGRWRNSASFTAGARQLADLRAAWEMSRVVPATTG